MSQALLGSKNNSPCNSEYRDDFDQSQNGSNQHSQHHLPKVRHQTKNSPNQAGQSKLMRFKTLKPGQLSVAQIIGWKSHLNKKDKLP